MTNGLLGRSCLLSSMFERERNDVMRYSHSPCPSRWLFLTCEPQTNPPPSGSCEKRAAMMIAWRVSPPACLPVVDLPMLPRRCRLVGRGGERTVFVPGSVLAICRLVLVLVLVLVVPSRRRGSYPWRLASMSCPSCLILFACYHCSSRPASRFSSRRASRCNRPAFDVFFLCLFHPVLRWHALARFVPVPVSFQRLVAPSRRASRAEADRHVLLA